MKRITENDSFLFDGILGCETLAKRTLQRIPNETALGPELELEMLG